MSRRIYRALGFALLVLPFLPLPELFGEIVGGRDLVGPSEWLLGMGIFACLAWFLALAGREDGLPLSSLARWNGRRLAWMVMFALAAVLLGTARWVFELHPLSIDSIVQVFQAKIFASGALTAPIPPSEGFFATQHMLVTEAGWFAQYPPGHAALLASGEALSLIWAVPVCLSLGTALLTLRFVSRVYDRATASICAVLLLIAPFFWVMGASFMNHVSALFFLALVLNLYAEWEARGTAVWALGAGLALGGAALARPLTAAAVGLVLAAFQLNGLRRKRIRVAGLAALVGFLGVAGLYLAFNARTTGQPLLPGYLALWGENHGLGFHESPWGDLHSPLTGLRNELTDLSLLNVFLFEWPIPSLLPIGILFAAGWGREGWDRRLLAGLVAIPCAYFFYWHRDGYLGPRFLYSTVLFAIPLTARAIHEVSARTAEMKFHPGGLFRPMRLSRYWGSLLLVCAAYGALIGIPRRVLAHASSMHSMKVDLTAEARDAGIQHALVFVAVSWGNRLLSRAQGAGVPLSLVQTAYRRIDHCDYQRVLDTADASDWPAGRIEQELRTLLAESHVLVQPAINLDPSLRLRPDRRPEPVCLDELAYDQLGYTIYAPHLLANLPGLNGDLVVARDLRGRNTKLIGRYTDRTAFLYRNGSFEVISTHPRGREK